MKDFFGKLIARFAFKSSPVLQLVANKTQEILASSPYQAWSQEHKDFSAQHIIKMVTEITSSRDKVLTLREHLSREMNEYAKSYVLLATEESDNLKLVGTDGVSGQLSDKIVEIVRNDQKLSEATKNLQDEEIKFFIHGQHLMAYLYCAVLNTVRIYLEDYQEKNDWYKPYFHALAAFAEDNFRKNINENSLFKGLGLGGLTYSMMYQEVLSGVDNPYLSWKEKYKKEINNQDITPPTF